MKSEEVVFILDMAPCTKCTLTRTERLAIQKTNALCATAAQKIAKEKAAERDDEKQKQLATIVLGKTVPMGRVEKATSFQAGNGGSL